MVYKPFILFPFSKPMFQNVFQLHFRNVKREGNYSEHWCAAPICFFCFVAHEQLYDDLKSWVSGRPLFSAAGVCQRIWILNQMETSSLKTCNLLCAEMHICLMCTADLWLPLRLFEITKEHVLKALNVFCFGFFFFSCVKCWIDCTGANSFLIFHKTRFNRL